MSVDVEELIKAVKGRKRQGKTLSFRGVTTDSRKAMPGEVFFALRGERYDGHAFVEEVFKRGALGAVVDKGFSAAIPGDDFVLIEVDDTLAALGRLASYMRGLYSSVPVVAISGSVGKTTTKEMTAAILSRSRKVLKTEGNMNNLVGLPLTLLRLGATIEACVLELGISVEGEMERLVEISSPDVALITNIGRGHLEGFKTPDGVARAKGPLFTGLKRSATKVVNIDDNRVFRLAYASPASRTISYSANGKKADVFVEHVEPDGLDGTGVTYNVSGKSISVRFHVAGAALPANGAAAIAAALHLGPSSEDIRQALSGYAPLKGRLVRAAMNGFVVLDDSYNANPESMSSALETLKLAPGRRVAVLGDMLELGDASKDEHAKLGRMAFDAGVELLMTVGAFASETAHAARDAGLKRSYSVDKKDVSAALAREIKRGDTVLVKGSRAVGLEAVVEELKRVNPS